MTHVADDYDAIAKRVAELNRDRRVDPACTCLREHGEEVIVSSTCPVHGGDETDWYGY